MTRNNDIRDYAKSKGMKIWELAECFGYYGTNESNFSRTLRVEWADEKKKKAKGFIDQIAERKEVHA